MSNVFDNIPVPYGVYHVVPIKDRCINFFSREQVGFTNLRDLELVHNTDNAFCWCDPEIKFNGQLIVHRSFDGREFVEELEKNNTLLDLPKLS